MKRTNPLVPAFDKLKATRLMLVKWSPSFTETGILIFFSTFLKIFKTWYKTLQAYGKNHDLAKAYGSTYEVPGTLEYEAHSVIEPQLKDKHEKATVKNKS